MPVHTKHIPLRRCAACGRQAPKGDLLRLVRRPTGEVTLDPRGKLTGRGAYLCRDAACWDRGILRGRLGAALKRPLEGHEGVALLSALNRDTLPGGGR